ncbi:MAG: transporter substrate-binding domain-containing protein [Pseudomonas neustonica]
MTSRSCLPLLLLLALLCGQAQAATLNIVSESWPPYIYEEHGQLKGIDYDVTTRVLSQLGYKTHWQLMPWRRALHDTASGNFDAILDISPTPERQQQYLFPTEPLSSSDSVLFYNKLHPHPFNGLEDLRGLNIVVSAGYLYSNPAFLEADFFSRIPATSNETSLLMLMRERVDMVIMNRHVGQFIINKLGLEQQIDHHPLVVSSGPLFLAFHRRPELAELAKHFAVALHRFKNSSEYLKILERYDLSDFNS